MNECIKEDRGDVRILHLSGELVIRYADRLKSVLVESFEDADRIEVDLSSVTEADIPCLQLFCAAHKTSMHLNKSFRFSNAGSDTFRQKVVQAGYLRHTGCVQDKSGQCLWAEEDKNG